MFIHDKKHILSEIETIIGLIRIIYFNYYLIKKSNILLLKQYDNKDVSLNKKYSLSLSMIFYFIDKLFQFS